MFMTGGPTTEKSTVETNVKNIVKTPVNMASLMYTPEEKERLLAYAIFIVVPLGDTGTGKTSLIRLKLITVKPINTAS